MTERGLPIADGAPACPFVAFEDDRDERATSPDHRHRCYAEAQPAPRALAHQEAYCLSSAFPVCPTFQDWARREAARSRGDAPRPSNAEVEGPEAIHRNPPRNWAEPPPWLSSRGQNEDDPAWPDDGEGDGQDGDEGDQVGAAVRADVPRRGRGLSGSYADRVASDPAAAVPGGLRDDLPDDTVDAVATPKEALPQRSRRRERPEAAGARPAQPRPAHPAPEWERSKPLEAYPTLRSRRLPELSVPPILIGVVALALAAAVVFALPGLLGFGNTPASSSAPPTTPIITPLPSFDPTPVPKPTPTIYVVQSGDTLSRIAGRFGIALTDLIAANAETLPDPNKLQIGDRLVIPAPVATEIPAASEIPAAT